MPGKYYNLSVQWHTHLWRAVKSPFTPNDKPWHTHLYRTCRSAVGHRPYAPLPRKYHNVKVAWHTHLYRGGLALVVKGEKPWHTHLYRSARALLGDPRYLPAPIISPETVEMGNLKRSVPLALDNLRAAFAEAKNGLSPAIAHAIASDLADAADCHARLIKHDFVCAPDTVMIAQKIAPLLRRIRRNLRPAATGDRPPQTVTPAPARPMMSVSIVISTLNRAPSLAVTLESLRWLKYKGPFEVIVVNGPSTDHTEDLLARWGERIRVIRCPAANVSVSRNHGIDAARGDIIACLDDDAIPEPEWLDAIVAAYGDPEVGAVGGFVYDYTGRRLQAGYTLINRLGDAAYFQTESYARLCFPYADQMPHMLGANCTFRRDVLLEIGGFNEEYEYFLV